jgi:hypothetical protein
MADMLGIIYLRSNIYGRRVDHCRTKVNIGIIFTIFWLGSGSSAAGDSFVLLRIVPYRLCRSSKLL